MNKTFVISFTAIIVLTGAPLLVQATQIAPNPNLGTIEIVNDPFAVNDANPFTNAGTINVDSASTLTNSVGAVLDNSDPSDPTTGAGGTLNNAGTLVNNGQMRNGGLLNNTGTLTNNGSLFTHSPLNNNGVLINNGLLDEHFGPITNAGTIINNSQLMMFGDNGLMEITSTGTLINNAGATLGVGFFLANAGTLINSGAMTFDIGGTLRNDIGGTLINNAGATLRTFASALDNRGILINDVGATLDNNRFMSNSGTLINNGQMSNTTLFSVGGLGNTGTLTNNGTLNNFASSTMSNSGTLTNNGQLTNNGTLNNSGTLRNNGSITGTGIYSQTAGQTINNGSLTQTSVIINGGILSGTGTITANVTVGSGATVSPGNPFGTLTINGAYASSGTTLFEIGGRGNGQFDVLRINGNATFTGGTVEFNFMNFDPKKGNSWDFLYASAISGWDSLTFLFTGLDPGMTAKFHFHNGIETLRIVGAPHKSSLAIVAASDPSPLGVAAVPEPSSLLLLGAGLAGIAGLRRKFY